MKPITVALVVAGCGSHPLPPPPPRVENLAAPAPPSPPAPPWLARCERALRRAGDTLIATGMTGPILTQRERWTDWGASAYDTFITAGATNWTLFPDPPVVGDDAADTDGLVFAIGRSMKFRVVLIPISCSPRAQRSDSWHDVQKYWDPDEIAKQAHGVSVTIHTDPTIAPLASEFLDRMRPIVEACLADRPEITPTRTCDPDPG